MLYDNTVVIFRSFLSAMSLTKFITNTFLSSFCLFALSAVAEVNVTTSIRPLQLIAQAIIEDRGTVRAAINAQDSAHGFTLTPSDRLNFESADLLLWISPEFEVQIANLFESMRKEKPVITAADLTGVSIISLSANELDPHLWLSSSNALAIAAGLTKELQKLDLANQADYQKAYTRFESNLNSTKTVIEDQLSNLVTLDYLVFHNAYQYFENEFGLRGGLALVQSAEVQPSMRDLLIFQNRVKQFSPSCILLEPDSDVQLVATALQGQSISRETVDLMGNEIEDGVSAFSDLLLGVADSFRRCLAN